MPNAITMRTTIAVRLLGLLAVLVLAAPSVAAPTKGPAPAPPTATSPYLRVVRDAAGKPAQLQTAVSHVVLGTGQRVDLVAAVHIAEASYFADLNQRFKQYDVVLYELILDAPDGRPTGGVVIPSDGKGKDSSLSQFQLGLCNLLGLEFQLHRVDYSAPNFRHADLTAAEFKAAMSRSGETPLTLMMRILQAALENPGAVDQADLENVDLLSILMRGQASPKEQKALRRVFAVSFPRIDGLLAQVQGTPLLEGRNRRALEVLDQQLAAGRRKLAIFYGGAHMAALEAQLLKRPGARVESRDWLTAWHL